MIGFEYKYTTSSDIINNIKLLTEYSITEYSVLTALIFIFLIFLYYIIPIISIIKKEKKKKKIKEKKNETLRLIIMQQKISSEIEEELDIH